MSAPGTSVKQALIEELRDYYEQFENLKDDALELSAPLSDSQFNWRPSPKAVVDFRMPRPPECSGRLGRAGHSRCD